MSDHIITAPDGAEFTTSELRESLTAFVDLTHSSELLDTLAVALTANGVGNMALTLLDEVDRLADLAVADV